MNIFSEIYKKTIESLEYFIVENPKKTINYLKKIFQKKFLKTRTFIL